MGESEGNVEGLTLGERLGKQDDANDGIFVGLPVGLAEYTSPRASEKYIMPSESIYKF